MRSLVPCLTAVCLAASCKERPPDLTDQGLSDSEVLPDSGVSDLDADSVDLGASDTETAAEVAPVDATGVGAPFDDTWVPLGATKCIALYHPKPETGVEAGKWVPCASGVPDCRRLATPWAPDGARWALSLLRGELVAGKPVLPYVRIYAKSATTAGSEYASVLVVEPLDGVPKHAMGFPLDAPKPYCSLMFGLGGAGVVHAGGGDLYRDAGRLLLVTAPWSSVAKPTTREVPFGEIGLSFTSFGSVWASDAAGYLASATYRLVPFDLVTGAFATGASTKAPVASFPVAAGPGVVVASASPYGFSYVDPTGATTRLYDLPPGRWDNDHDVDAARARTVVWVESASTTSATPELWEMPFPPTGGPAKPRKIRDLPKVPRRIRANDGVVLVMYGNADADLVRASDGVSISLKPESGYDFSEPVWVDSREWIVGLSTPPTIDATTMVRRTFAFK